MTRMCKKLALASTLAVLLLVPAAFADTLKYTDGGQVTGMIDGVNFEVGGLPNFYLRDNIGAIALTDDGKDTLTVGDGGKREGKLVSVRLKTGDGIVSVARKQLSAIEIEVVKIEEKPADSAVETKEAAISPEQKAALVKNREMKDDYTKQAGEELKKFAAKEPAYKAACDAIVTLQRTIDNKIQARQNRENQPQQRTTYTDSSGRTHTREVTNNNNNYNDGLENDYRSLSKAQEKKSAMEKTLKDEKTKLENRFREKEKVILRAYGDFRKAIVANNIPSEEAMALKYKAALTVGDARKAPAKSPSAKVEKQPGASAKSEE